MSVLYKQWETSDTKKKEYIENQLIPNLLENYLYHDRMTDQHEAYERSIKNLIKSFLILREKQFGEKKLFELFSAYYKKELYVANPIVRANAITLFCLLFPLCDNEEDIKYQFFLQLDIVKNQLLDSSPLVRLACLQGVFDILDYYYDVLSEDQKIDILEIIFKKMIYDKYTTIIESIFNNLKHLFKSKNKVDLIFIPYIKGLKINMNRFLELILFLKVELYMDYNAFIDKVEVLQILKQSNSSQQQSIFNLLLSEQFHFDKKQLKYNLTQFKSMLRLDPNATIIFYQMLAVTLDDKDITILIGFVNQLIISLNNDVIYTSITIVVVANFLNQWKNQSLNAKVFQSWLNDSFFIQLYQNSNLNVKSSVLYLLAKTKGHKIFSKQFIDEFFVNAMELCLEVKDNQNINHCLCFLLCYDSCAKQYFDSIIISFKRYLKSIRFIDAGDGSDNDLNDDINLFSLNLQLKVMLLDNHLFEMLNNNVDLDSLFYILDQIIDDIPKCLVVDTDYKELFQVIQTIFRLKVKVGLKKGYNVLVYLFKLNNMILNIPINSKSIILDLRNFLFNLSTDLLPLLNLDVKKLTLFIKQFTLYEIIYTINYNDVFDAQLKVLDYLLQLCNNLDESELDIIFEFIIDIFINCTLIYHAHLVVDNNELWFKQLNLILKSILSIVDKEQYFLKLIVFLLSILINRTPYFKDIIKDSDNKKLIENMVVHQLEKQTILPSNFIKDLLNPLITSACNPNLLLTWLDLKLSDIPNSWILKYIKSIPIPFDNVITIEKNENELLELSKNGTFCSCACGTFTSIDLSRFIIKLV